MPKQIMKWAKNPPGRATVMSEYDEALKELQARPGEWGLISRMPGKQQKGREAMRNRGCEVVSQHADGHTEVWAKWTPRIEETDDDVAGALESGTAEPLGLAAGSEEQQQF